MRDTVILRIEHSPDVYRATRTFGWFGMPRYLYPKHARAALLEVFPWEACLLAVLATTIGFAFGAQEAGTIGVCVALVLVTVQMLRTRTVLTETSLKRRTGLLFTRRGLMLPVGSISEVKVEQDPTVPEDFADLVVTAEHQAYRFRAVARPQEMAAAIRARAQILTSEGNPGGRRTMSCS